MPRDDRPTIPFHGRTARTARASSLFALTCTLLALPPALGVPLGQSGVLRGRIADWPPGQRGELRLESERVTFASGTVDASGDFTLPLPSAASRDLLLVPIARLLGGFAGESCVGDAKATPNSNSGAFRFFELAVYQDGQFLGDVLRRSSARHEFAPGEVTTQLAYFDAPLTLSGTLRCQSFTAVWNGSVSAGWNFLTSKAGRDGGGNLTFSRTSGEVASSQRWLLYAEFGGVGLSFAPQPDGSGVRVERVVAGMPAAKAGLRVGDDIEQIDGVDARAFSPSDVAVRVLGEPGQRLTLVVRRPNTAAPLRLDLVRAVVRVP